MNNKDWFAVRNVMMSFSEKAFMLSHMRQFTFTQDEYKASKKELLDWVDGPAKKELEEVVNNLYYEKGSNYSLLSATIKLKHFITVYHGLSACITDTNIKEELFDIQELLLLCV